MKRLFATALLIVTAASADTVLRACGDKFLVTSRGTRFERAPGARQTAAILLYADPGTGATASAANAPIQSILRKAGYRPTTVESAADFGKALSNGNWDVLIVDMTNGLKASSRFNGPAAPAVVPLARNLSEPELAQARQQFPGVVPSPAKSGTLLDAVAAALSSRVEAKTKAGH
ncbi:MAG: hypothetical protein ABIS06_21850 [Vicinamibacterales bacterium]